MPHPLEQTRITLANGIELDVVDCGPKAAPALIFLHGFPENHRTWRHQIAHLAGRFRCIAPDQRGYRGSSKPPAVSDYEATRLIGDIFLLADALGVGEFTILGHDWGGAIAWGVALGGQLNGRVRRAVIANAPHPVLFPELVWTNLEQRAASQYMRVFRDPANDALVEAGGIAAILAKGFGGDLPPNPKMPPEELAILLQDWENRTSCRAMLNWYRASPFEVPPMDAPARLPAGYTRLPLPPLTIPTLVIWALDDAALPPCNLEGMDQVVTNLTIERIAGCGHFVPWEAPDAVNAALDRFLASPPADG